MWYGYDEIPLLMYLVGGLMSAMLMLRLVPDNTKNTAFRILIQNNAQAVVYSTNQVIGQLPFTK
jgi:hypothetical protein